MLEIIAFVHKYPFEIAACYWLFATIVHAMPAPEASTGIAYRWLYGVCQVIAANWGKIMQTVPAAPVSLSVASVAGGRDFPPQTRPVAPPPDDAGARPRN